MSSQQAFKTTDAKIRKWSDISKKNKKKKKQCYQNIEKGRNDALEMNLSYVSMKYVRKDEYSNTMRGFLKHKPSTP